MDKRTTGAEAPQTPGQALRRLDEATRRLGIDFGLWSDRAKATREFHYEVRVFGRADVRFIERGASLAEAVTKAADRLEPPTVAKAGG